MGFTPSRQGKTSSFQISFVVSLYGGFTTSRMPMNLEMPVKYSESTRAGAD